MTMKTRKRKNKFVIDVDDVLRNLVPNMVRLYNKEFGLETTHEDIKDYRLDTSFPKLKENGYLAAEWFFMEHGHELFLESEAIEKSVEAITRLKQYGTIHIVTKQRYLLSKLYTIQWLDKNDILYDSLSFVEDKSIVGCDFFIDDYQENFVGCGKKGAIGILIEAPYNKDVDLAELKKKTNFEEIIRYESLSAFADDIESFI